MQAKLRRRATTYSTVPLSIFNELQPRAGADRADCRHDLIIAPEPQIPGEDTPSPPPIETGNRSRDFLVNGHNLLKALESHHKCHQGVKERSMGCSSTLTQKRTMPGKG